MIKKYSTQKLEGLYKSNNLADLDPFILLQVLRGTGRIIVTGGSVVDE